MEESKAKKLESDLNEARTKYTDAERKATEAEATHTAALTAIKAMKDQELAQQCVELTTKHEEEVRRIAFLPEAVVVEVEVEAAVIVATASYDDGETVNIFIFFSLVVIISKILFLRKKQQQQQQEANKKQLTTTTTTDVNTRLEAKISSMGLEISQLESVNQGLSECMAFMGRGFIGRNNKQRSFMFAYHGQHYIQKGILVGIIEHVETGIFSDDMMYGVIKLHANKTKRESSLPLVINEYNAAVGIVEHRIIPVALPMATTTTTGQHCCYCFPAIMPAIRWSGNPIEIKRDKDKATGSFRFFVNNNNTSSSTSF